MSGKSKIIAKEEMGKNLKKILVIAVVYSLFTIGTAALSIASKYYLKAVPNIVIKLIFVFIVQMFLTQPISYGWTYSLISKNYRVKNLFVYFKPKYFLKVVLLCFLFSSLPNLILPSIKAIMVHSAIVFLIFLLVFFVSLYSYVQKFIFIRYPEASTKENISYAFNVYMNNLGKIAYFELTYLGWSILIILTAIALMSLRNGLLFYLVLAIGIFLYVYVYLYYNVSKAVYYNMLIEKYESPDDDIDDDIDDDTRMRWTF